MNKVDEAVRTGQTRALHIDFKAGDTLDDDVARLPDLEELALRNCPAEFVLPNALRALGKLKTMTLTAADDKLVLPKSIADLPLEHVGVWHLASTSDLALLKQITSLFIVVNETAPDVAAIAAHLPHLVRLEVWGSHMKSGTLPPDIARFTNLESLDLVSCGLSDLPPDIVRLSKLRELRMRGLPMTIVPEIVSDMATLELLQLAGLSLTGLPASLAKLANLRTLDVGGALNGGALLSSFDEAQLDRMKPIPRVVSELTWLTELVIGRCGVVDPAPLRALSRLEKLKLDWSAMPTLDDVGSLASLTDLSLAHCSRVHDFGPLANLSKLRTLDMQSTRPESLAFLKSLGGLTDLNVARIRCEDMSALFELDIAKLEASDDVRKKWSERAALRDLPSIDAVKRDLGADEPAVVGRALSALAKHVRAASSDDENALASFFDVEIEDETTVVDVPPLDRALHTHAQALSTEALGDAFAMALLQVGNNFRAALLVAEESVRRGEEDLQLRIVEAFLDASEHYDAGHRYDESTVHDQLIDDIFPKLAARPLAALLEPCGNDHLNRDGGDRMDALFAPAFARVDDDATWDALAKKLETYVRDQAEYGKLEAVDALTDEIAQALPDDAKKSRFDELLTRMREEQKELRHRAKIREDAESRDPERIVRAIAESKNLDDAGWKDASPALASAATRPDVAWESKRIVLDRALAARDDHWTITRPLCALLREDAPRARRELEATGLAKDRLAKELRTALLDVARLPADDDAKKKFPVDVVRAWAGELDGISSETWREREITETMRAAATSYQAERIEEVVAELATFSGTIDLTQIDSSYGGTTGDRLADAVGQLVTYAKEPMFALSLQFHKIRLLDKTRERILAQLFGLAAANDRRDVLDALTPLLPARVENPVLAYNLACWWAKADDKLALLAATARALELGKSPTQFRKDTDFAAFLDDPDFEALLEKAL